jgi:hypothetical protein
MCFEYGKYSPAKNRRRRIIVVMYLSHHRACQGQPVHPIFQSQMADTDVLYHLSPAGILQCLISCDHATPGNPAHTMGLAPYTRVKASDLRILCEHCLTYCNFHPDIVPIAQLMFSLANYHRLKVDGIWLSLPHDVLTQLHPRHPPYIQ